MARGANCSSRVDAVGEHEGKDPGNTDLEENDEGKDEM